MELDSGYQASITLDISPPSEGHTGQLMLPIEIYPLVADVSGEIWKLGFSDWKENMKMATEPWQSIGELLHTAWPIFSSGVYPFQGIQSKMAFHRTTSKLYNAGILIWMHPTFYKMCMSLTLNIEQVKENINHVARWLHMLTFM